MSFDESIESEPEPEALLTVAHDPYTALRLRNFQYYLAGNVLAIFGMQMQTVAVQWEIYERTHSPLALGLVGLVQFLPVVCLTLPAGHEADRSHRKAIVMIAMLSIASCSLGLAWVSRTQGDIGWMYLLLLLSGVSRAFLQPAKASLLPQIVPRDAFSNAVTWNMSAFQLAAILGPAAGGQLIGYSGRAWPVYLIDAASTAVFFALLAAMHVPKHAATASASTSKALLAGFRFVWRNKIVLAAITLDMFAVLLGGAVALLPVYAEDILQVGAQGLGWLRTAPAVGALVFSFVLAHRPPTEHAGRTLLWVVAGFGAATMVFGVSQSYPLSLAMLFLTGAFDIVSVVIRHTLVQLLTPDDMRGRVSAINSVFIGASNELGAFESGLVAQLFTPAISVVSGGIGTLVVVLLVAAVWPQLRRYGRLQSDAQSDS
ncbi:MAG: MFS transporter [Planctomycetia bacterium 21-64-5]|nr:MAG: MFS transporter [Planctomycetia bacterium 21-64-5]HQU42934.1 MFS transporter [Pirellulales bacterium]